MSARASIALVLSLGLVTGGCAGPGSSATSSGEVLATPATTATTGLIAGSPGPSGSAEVPTEGPLPAWAQVAPGGDQPAAREDHTWTVDEGGAIAYLFGGRDGSTVHGDIWAYGLATDAWQRIDVSGASPAARFGHEAAWVPGHGLVVFGGQAGSTFFGDLWLFNAEAARWEELPAAGAPPVARYGSCSAIGSDGHFWISHGFTENGTRFDDTRAYDLDARSWADETPAGDLPVKRCLHVCWWTADERLALYGGQTNGTPALGDLWAYSAGDGAPGWTPLGEPLPLARNLVAAAVVEDSVVLFGGRTDTGVAVGDLYVVAGDLSRAEAIATTGATPTPRWAATLIHDSARGRLLLLGGTDGAASSEMWELRWMP